MKPNNMPRDNRKAAIAQIHIAKSQMNMDDDAYRAMLRDVTGKASCKQMRLNELYAVIKRLEKLGFKNTRSKSRKKYSPRAKGQIIDVMRAIWIQMYQAGHIVDGSETALLGFAKRQTARRNGGIGVDSLEWLEQDQELASQVLEDLKQWQKRVENQEINNGNG